jgi:flavin reductase (DIM6/NTAB) family NADH-FMN oxidoreductase RutF
MSDSTGISADDFKKGMRELAAAVNVITVAHDGKQDGLTATAACSVSAEPPQLLICVNKEAGGHDLIQDSGKFVLNIMARDQEDIAMRFAGMDGADRSERFGLGSWSELVTGTPCLDGALVNFDCEVAQQITAGTHSIYIGLIVGCRTGDKGGAPLLYGDGQFTGLATRE